MNRTIFHSFVLSIAAAVLTPTAKAQDWPQWRGPHFNGSSPAKNLPETFSKTENVLWTTAMPGPGAGTPAVWQNRVFVSAWDAQSKKLLALCVDRKDGKVLWRKEVGLGSAPNDRNNPAGPSPITDGKTAWFYFGTGDLAAFDVEGKPLWSRNLTKDHGSFNFLWLYASSPLLWESKLYIQVLHRDTPISGPAPAEKAQSYLLAIDPQTGKDLWKVFRPDQAEQESKESYGTPIPFEGSPRKEVVLVGGDTVTGHNAETGKELWRAGDWNQDKRQDFRLVPSAVTADGLAFACAPKNGPVMAIKADGDGEITKTHMAWESREFTSDVCVPLYYDKKLYVLDGDRKKIHRVDPKTGKLEQSTDLGGDAVFRASPTGADGKIYCMNERGGVWVVAVDGLKVLSQTDLGGDTASRASVAAADGQVFVRTGDTLYCFGKK